MFNGGNVAAPLDKLLLVSHKRESPLGDYYISRDSRRGVAGGRCTRRVQRGHNGAAPATKAAILSGRVITPAGSGGM